MTERVLGPSGSTRRRRFLFWPILMVACTALFFVAGAQAVHDTGAFQLDGNASSSTSSATPPDDWDRVCHQVLGSDCSTTFNTTGSYPNGQTGATAVSWTAEANPSSSIFTGGGSKDPSDINQWAWKDAGGLPDKDNLQHGFAARYSLTPSATCPSAGGPTCDVLFFGSDRFDNSGDAQQGFWLLQNEVTLGNTPSGGGFNFNGVHRLGDILIISDFSNGGTTSFISVYKWNPAVSGNLELLSSSGNARCDLQGAGDASCGIVNSGTITLPWTFVDKSGTPNNGALNGEFYEGGINLSTLGVANECFASIASETRSSTSTTATLKDFVLGGFGHCTSGLVTTPKDGAGASIPAGGLNLNAGASLSVKDSATLTIGGVQTWSGTLKFFLCGPADPHPCATGGTQIGPAAGVNVTNTTTQPFLSDAATITSAGQYCWRATFTHITTGVPDASDASNGECFTVNPKQPTIPTVASAPVALGGNVSDTANLAGTANKPGTPVINPTTAGAAAGGSITFRLYGPNDATCAAANLVFTSAAIPVSGDGPYGSGNFAPTAVGTYRWIATYTGDTPNTLGVAGTCGASNESVIVSSSNLTTTPKTGAGGTIPNPFSIGTGSVSVADSASLTVSGASTWTGTLTFFLCKVDSPGLCTSGGTQIGSGQTVNQSTTFPVLSDAATVTAAGRYCWRGVFTSGTTGVPNSTDATSGECFTVAPKQPSIPTQASGTVVLGNAVSDTANLSGTANQPGSPIINPTVAGAAAGGSITFRLYGPSATNSCTAANLVFTSSAIPVSGDAAYGSGNFTPTVAGTYRWIASYTGDSPNTLSVDGVCGASNESVVISPKTPTITTQVNTETPVSLGNAISDTATLGNTATPSNGIYGTITFTAYVAADDATCGTFAYTSVVDVVAPGDGDYNSATGTGGLFIPTVPGHYHWMAVYTPASGDVNNQSATTACLDLHETSIIIQLQPTMNTNQNFVPNDAATITVASGAGALAGHVVFKLYVNNATCTDPADYTSSSIDIDSGQPLPGTPGLTKTVSSGNTTAYGTNGTTFSWVVTYSTDNTGHRNVSSPCTNETSSITIDNGTQQP